MSCDSKPMKVATESVKDIAKTTSNAIDLTREAGRFFSKFISGSMEQGMGILEDKLRYVRWERQVRLQQKANEFIKNQSLGEPDERIPLKNAIPLFEYATIEEDNNLQDLWAQLLVNGTHSMSGITLKRAFIEILSQLSLVEAQIMQAIYILPFQECQHAGVLTKDLPKKACIDLKNSDEDLLEPSEEIKISLANLARLGCLRLGFTWGNGESFSKVNPTILGREFVKACSSKTKI